MFRALFIHFVVVLLTTKDLYYLVVKLYCKFNLLMIQGGPKKKPLLNDLINSDDTNERLFS